MKEFGGYLELEHFCGAEYHADAVGVNSGRNALLYILKARNIRKIYIPYFVCDAVCNVCAENGVHYSRYCINDRFLPLRPISLQPDEWLYIVNAYGQLTDGDILELKRQYHRVIVDNVMDFFRKPLPGVDTVYSCRKFFGVPDGGYVSTDTRLEEPLEIQASRDRMIHLMGRFETSGSEYYQAYHTNEAFIDTMPLKAMSALTRNILKGVDYPYVIARRNENYTVLNSILEDLNKKQFTMPNGSFCYPLMCHNAQSIRKQLVGQQIYIPTLWPNVLKDCDQESREYQYARDILPIPCDQRYSKEDMVYLANIIREALEAEEA